MKTDIHFLSYLAHFFLEWEMFQTKGVEKIKTHILTFCWPCISVYFSQYLTNLMHKICFTISFISCLYMFRAHVLIIRRSKLHYTASGIITPINLLWNKFCASSWLNTEINILRCTVSKTSKFESWVRNNRDITPMPISPQVHKLEENSLAACHTGLIYSGFISLP